MFERPRLVFILASLLASGGAFSYYNRQTEEQTEPAKQPAIPKIRYELDGAFKQKLHVLSKELLSIAIRDLPQSEVIQLRFNFSGHKNPDFKMNGVPHGHLDYDKAYFGIMREANIPQAASADANLKDKLSEITELLKTPEWGHFEKQSWVTQEVGVRKEKVFATPQEYGHGTLNSYHAYLLTTQHKIVGTEQEGYKTTFIPTDKVADVNITILRQEKRGQKPELHEFKFNLIEDTVTLNSTARAPVSWSVTTNQLQQESAKKNRQ